MVQWLATTAVRRGCLGRAGDLRQCCRGERVCGTADSASRVALDPETQMRAGGSPDPSRPSPLHASTVGRPNYFRATFELPASYPERVSGGKLHAEAALLAGAVPAWAQEPRGRITSELLVLAAGCTWGKRCRRCNRRGRKSRSGRATRTGPIRSWRQPKVIQVGVGSMDTNLCLRRMAQTGSIRTER